MNPRQFEFGASSPYVNLIDSTFDTSIGSLLNLLGDECDEQWGFNYELRSKIKQYYSNVHATVLFNLYSSHLLNEEELKKLREILLRLRDSNLIIVYRKRSHDKYAWDVIEGPSAFSTSLACYALLLSGDDHIEEIGRSIRWLLNQRNNDGIWPTFIKGGSDNYVTTFYATLALQLWRRWALNAELEEIDDALQQVQNLIEDSFVSSDGYYFVPKYTSTDTCLSNTIVCLHILKLLASNKFSEILDGAKPIVERLILEDNDWYISELSHVRERNRIKTMYTYNPSYLISLLQMDWDVTDRVILKMLF